MSTDSNLGGALTRRVFLLGTAGMAVAGVTGCGGGGGGKSPGERFNGTYRYYDSSLDIAASVTVDDAGRVTYWTLAADPTSPFADFGQTTLRDDRFSLTEQGITSSGRISGNNIDGLTQDDQNTSVFFDWFARKEGNPDRNEPPFNFVGTFEASMTQIVANQNLRIDVLLGVSPDGNASILCYFKDLDTGDDLYTFEGFAVDDLGNAYNYFLDLYGDRFSLRDNGGNSATVLITFGRGLGVLTGRTAEVPVFRTDLAVARSRALSTRSARMGNNGALRRAAEALRAK